jgi:hypothetical protein
MSIKQKAYSLATEHRIEIWFPDGLTRNDSKTYQINLPEGMQLADGTTGLSLDYNNLASNYQNWKAILQDVQELVEQKTEWREIEKVVA